MQLQRNRCRLVSDKPLILTHVWLTTAFQKLKADDAIAYRLKYLSSKGTVVIEDQLWTQIEPCIDFKPFSDPFIQTTN